ncbi:MAG: DUF4199 domain-containing protein [Flammeovirgaceae bacterium]|nr:DUF4199 domain-containing protein [Flammeovirgaceae bacterium]
MHGLGVLALSGLVATIFAFVLYNFIDSGIATEVNRCFYRKHPRYDGKFGAPEESIEPALEKAKEQSEKQFTVGGQALGYVYMVVFSAIMALISAIFVKKNEPEEVL